MGDYGLGTRSIRRGLRAEARPGNSSVCFDVNAAVSEVQGRGERWGFLSTQGEGNVSVVDVERASVR